MWDVTLHDALRGYKFQPPQSDDLSADGIMRMAELVAEADAQEMHGAVEALRSFVALSREASGEAVADGSMGGRVSMLEPIYMWASEAVEAAADDSGRVELTQFDRGLALIEDEELSSFAWHGDTIAIVPITDTSTAVELTYRPSQLERARRDRIYANYSKELSVRPWWPWPEIEMSADVVGFFSDTEGGSISAEIKERSVESPRHYRFQVELAPRAAGLLVVKPLYRLARNLRVRERDPLWRARARRAERGLTGLAPHLRDSQPTNGRMIVLVHGLASTAAEMAEMLAPLALDVARFEHDTFISIDANASDLSKLLADQAGDAERIILLCHSRGGLVARAAADLLRPPISARTSIHTFGTPHMGTPLADFAPFARQIQLMDSLGHPSDVLRSARRYLRLGYWRTPEGIEEMSPDHPFIDRMINGPHKQLQALNTWGAEYKDICAGAWWHRRFAAAFARVLPAPHDLVVPVSSSVGAGVDQGPMRHPSTHFDYLGDNQIRSYIRSIV